MQVFDSCAGVLTPGHYSSLVLPYTQRVVAAAQVTGVPVIYFGTDLNGLLEALPETGADVIGMDWRIDLDAAWARLGDGVAVQGNLDPVALFGPWAAVRGAADARAGGRAVIFSLGHGILPETPVNWSISCTSKQGAG